MIGNVGIVNRCAMEKTGVVGGAERQKWLWWMRHAQASLVDVVMVSLNSFLLCSWFLEEKDLKCEWIPLTYARFCFVF